MKIFLRSLGLLSFIFSIGIASIVDNQESQPVVVRIWNDASHGGVHVGHVSIDTGERYISLWPSGEDRAGGDLHIGESSGSSFIKYIAQRVSGGCVIAAQATGMSLMGDLIAEERVPEQVYQLKLNTRAMNNFWDLLCDTADKSSCDYLPNVGEPLYTRQMITFKDLTWYVGGDPSKHKIAGKPDLYLEERLQKGQHYSCSSLGLHMLVIGEITRYGNIDDTTLTGLIPAIEKNWYQHMLSKPNPEDFLKEAEPEPVLESWFGDAMGRVAAKALRPLIERITASDYVTPWQVGELVRRCCVNQYYTFLTIPPELEIKSLEIKEYISEILSSYYPEKELLKKNHLKYEDLLECDPANFNLSQQVALSSYFMARGRTINDIQPLLNMRLAQISNPKSSKIITSNKFSTKKEMDSQEIKLCLIS